MKELKDKQLDNIRYILNNYFKSRCNLQAEDVLMLVNNMAYAETEKELDEALMDFSMDIKLQKKGK